MVVSAPKMVKTFWNGELTKARRCIVQVADSGFFPEYWAKHLVGQHVRAVEVIYGDETMYLYDEEGLGWFKVTQGFGSPHVPHGNLIIEGITSYYD